MPILRRTLAASAVAAAATVTFALPAYAHVGTFDRTCDHVTVHLTQFSDKGKNTVHVTRDGQKDWQVITFDGASTDMTFSEDNTTPHMYQAFWIKSETADHRASHTKVETPDVPKDCDVVPPTSSAPATSPAPTSSAPATPTVAPTMTSPAAPSAAPSTSAAAVSGRKLANTGAGNTVPLIAIGSVLVLGGAGLTVVTRRRRSGGAAS